MCCFSLLIMIVKQDSLGLGLLDRHRSKLRASLWVLTNSDNMMMIFRHFKENGQEMNQ